jgi:glycosyltransferase involved in cell wall biosynthesis
MLAPMPSAPRASVIVPVHRGTEALKTSLHSILHQTLEDLEIVVAGDGADDAVERVVLSYRDSRVRWFGFPKAPGFGYSNRSRAIGQTTGRLIAYLAPDDLWAPDHLERLVAVLEKDRLDLVFSRPILVVSTRLGR